MLYFYPAAFTKGCTTEAHEFADATTNSRRFGATVIGVSHDDMATLDKFSVSECRSKFAVAADPNGRRSRPTTRYWREIPLMPTAHRM